MKRVRPRSSRKEKSFLFTRNYSTFHGQIAFTFFCQCGTIFLIRVFYKDPITCYVRTLYVAFGFGLSVQINVNLITNNHIKSRHVVHKIQQTGPNPSQGKFSKQHPCEPSSMVNAQWTLYFETSIMHLMSRKEEICFHFQIQTNANQVMVSALTRVSILRAPIVVNVARDFSSILMEDLAQVRWC